MSLCLRCELLFGRPLARIRNDRMTVTLEAGLVAREPESLCAFYTQTMAFRLVDRMHFDVGTVYKLRRDEARLKIFFSTAAIDPAIEADPWFRPGGWRSTDERIAKLGGRGSFRGCVLRTEPCTRDAWRPARVGGSSYFRIGRTVRNTHSACSSAVLPSFSS